MKSTAELAYELLIAAKPGTRASVLRERLITAQKHEQLRAEIAAEQHRRDNPDAPPMITHIHREIRTG